MNNRIFLSFVCGLSLMGCKNGCDEIDGDTVEVSDANNYLFDGTLEIESIPVAPQPEGCGDKLDSDDDGEIDEEDECNDYSISWDEVSVDLQLHDTDPVADIDTLAMTNFRYLSEPEVEIGLSLNTLQQVDVGLYVDTQTGDASSMNLSDLSLFGNDINVEQYLSADFGTFILIIQTGDNPGVGTRMATFIKPTEGETNTDVVFTDTSTVLEFEVDMQSLTPIPMFPDRAGVVDWSNLETNGLMEEFNPSDADQVMVGFYEGLTLTDVESQFLDLEQTATRIWTADISGQTDLDLSELEGDEAFEGVHGDGVWLFTLRCTACPNPAPLFLTEMTACGLDE